VSSADRVRSVALVAEVYGKINSPNTAGRLLGDCEQQIAKVENPRSQAQLLLPVAQAYGRVGKDQDAQRVVNQAVATADRIESLHDRADVLADLAAVQLALGQRDMAVAILEAAAAHAVQVPDLYGRVHAVCRVAREFSRVKVADRAHELLAGAEKVVEQITAADEQKEALDLVRKLKRELPRPS
jgi:tetratricopeptide (TPR) repeat protein